MIGICSLICLETDLCSKNGCIQTGSYQGSCPTEWEKKVRFLPVVCSSSVSLLVSGKMRVWEYPKCVLRECMSPLSLKWHVIWHFLSKKELKLAQAVSPPGKTLYQTSEVSARETKDSALFLGWLQPRLCIQNVVLDFLTSRSWSIGSLGFFQWSSLPRKPIMFSISSGNLCCL